MKLNVHLKRRSLPDLRPRLPEQDGSWVAANRRSFFDYSVGSLVPVVFEGYARILHPAWASDGEPVRWEAVAAWSGRTIHGLAQWEFISLPLADRPSAAPFVAPPREGGLPPQQLGALCILLAAHTATPERCLVGLWEGYGGLDETEWGSSPVLVLDRRTFLVQRGAIDFARAVGLLTGNRLPREGPTIFWPEDRAWFVASDPDLDSTYVGGSDALITALLGHGDLEAWPAEPGDLVHVGSDEVNAG